MSASADVLAQAKVELAIASIPEGKNVRQSLSEYARLLALISAQDSHQMAWKARFYSPSHER
jgi:hypothetical protein